MIVTNIGGLPETVMPAATGWLVEPDNPDELAWALDLALSMEKDVRERLADRARHFVAEELSIDQMSRRTLDVYRELVKDAPRPQAMAVPPIKDDIVGVRAKSNELAHQLIGGSRVKRWLQFVQISTFSAFLFISILVEGC
ncbi:MAG: glycosyltransferase [Geminicoccaceae bacterium]